MLIPPQRKIPLVPHKNVKRKKYGPYHYSEGWRHKTRDSYDVRNTFKFQQQDRSHHGVKFSSLIALK